MESTAASDGATRGVGSLPLANKERAKFKAQRVPYSCRFQMTMGSLKSPTV